MTIIQNLISFILHIDQHLVEIIQQFGSLVVCDFIFNRFCGDRHCNFSIFTG